MRGTYDAVVLGAGHNGLVAATFLARAGLRTLVLERRQRAGGAAATQEPFPGFKFDTGAQSVGRIHPAVLRALKLDRRGVEFQASDPTVFAPTLEQGHLLLRSDPRQSAGAIRELSASDASRWEPFCERVRRATDFLATLYDEPAPAVISRSVADTLRLLGVARRLRRLGRREMMEVLRILPMTVAELLDEWFESDALKGALAADGIRGIFQGPMAAGTAFLFLHHQLNPGNGKAGVRAIWRVRGGMGRLAEALADAAREAGAEIRTGVAVERILVADGGVSGVLLKGGEELGARRVVSNADPRQTFLRLLDPVNLEPALVRAIRNIRFRGACARINLALGELPRFESGTASAEHLGGVICIAPSIRYLERAFDDAKYGALSREPYLEAMIPSVMDPDLAPSGRHVMQVTVQYAPYHLKDGAWDKARSEALTDRVIETLGRYAPNLESAVIHRQTLTPLDLELSLGLSEGNMYHGEMTLDQILFMRPIPGCSRYRTPVTNLYLCGAGTHPGGGVTGAPGYHAARAVLADARRG